jgi:hypothetical protein
MVIITAFDIAGVRPAVADVQADVLMFRREFFQFGFVDVFHASRLEPDAAIALAMLNIGVIPTPPAISTTGFIFARSR